MPKSSVKSTDRFELGKSVSFVVTEVLLDGRQVSLDLQRSQETAILIKISFLGPEEIT